MTAAGSSSGKDVPKTYIRAKWGELTEGAALRYLQATADYTGLFEYSEVARDGKISVTLTDDFGAKGSLFFSDTCRRSSSRWIECQRFLPDENAVAFELQ